MSTRGSFGRGFLLFLLCTVLSPAFDGGGKEKLVRYYQAMTAWINSEAYTRIINDFEAIMAQQEQILTRSGYADDDALAAAEAQWQEDETVLQAKTAMEEASRRQKAANNRANRGRMVVRYGTPAKKRFREVQQVVKASGILEFLANHINENFYLPRNLTITLADCGEENAFYDRETHTITICYEIVAMYRKYLQENGEDDDILSSLVLFDILHEFGHALIDEFNLPITGREEDVADQLATWFILETIGEDDQDSVARVLTAAYWFGYEFNKEEVAAEDLPFWDSHSLDPQRYHNIICWAYGYNAELTENVLGEDLDQALPEERRGQCEEEYTRLFTSFMKFLERYMKE